MFSSNTSQVSNDVNYIEDVFSNFLYTGNGSTQTITNGIDLAGKGGLVWVKKRDSTTVNASHYLVDTVRGAGNYLSSNSTNASASDSQISAFNSNGFYIGSDGANVNLSGSAYASWTFRKQPKFFDVVTYTGNGTTQTINHNLGSVPGCIIIKRYSDSGWAWRVYHRSLGNTQGIYLDLTNAAVTSSSFWNNTDPTSTQFTVGNDGGVNGSGQTFVAYIFAHNAGGFGLTGTDNVISCGSYTGNGSATGPTVTLGHEPQWVLIKRTDSASGGAWALFDNMRGLTVAGSADPVLYPNSSDAEFTGVDILQPLATGFQLTGTNWNTSGGTYIYIAIRRGPMKVPTSGTSVFDPQTYTGNDTSRTLTPNFVVDLGLTSTRDAYNGFIAEDRLRGATKYLEVAYTTSESTNNGTYTGFDSNTSVYFGGSPLVNSSAHTYITYLIRRAPGFFDIVCPTSNGSGVITTPHNLGVTPELAIVRDRQNTASWYVLRPGTSQYLLLNSTGAQGGSLTISWSATSFSNDGNFNNANQVVYLFATLPGVSKVGSYTGTGTTQQINCGFTAGARFVLIKRTDSTGDWYVWDSARGIVAGNDPYLLLNSTAAEVTSTDYVDTYSAGFEISSTAPAAINASGGTFIYLAIA